MDIGLILTFLSGGLVVAVFNHYMGIKKETEQHRRERKEDQYKELLEALSGFFSGTEDNEKKRRFMLELHTNAMLFASSAVIRRGNEFVEAFANKAKMSAEERDELANEVVLAIRKEMGVDEKDQLSVGDIKRYKLD